MFLHENKTKQKPLPPSKTNKNQQTNWPLFLVRFVVGLLPHSLTSPEILLVKVYEGKEKKNHDLDGEANPYFP